MKKYYFKRIMCITLIILSFFMVFSPEYNNGLNIYAAIIDETEANSDYVDNLRYGFNVTSGNALCDDGLNIANPILKPISEGLYKYISKNESNTKTVAGNYISDSIVGIASESGQIYSGGIGALISAVNMNVDVTFDRNSSTDYSYSERYEAYYQQINRISYVIQGNVDLRNYLTDDFKNDMYSIQNESDAVLFLNKYGTHLFTGFQYGGLFQVTNYIKTTDNSADINQVTSLSTKMQTAFGFYGGGTNFSFSEQYAVHEQQSYGTSNYKFNMFGGESVTAVSLDQLFTYNSSMIDGKGNYIYDRWVTSINNGQQLAIVGTPSSARNIPLWELLPSEGYNEIKSLLKKAYTKLCGDKYNEFLEKYPTTPRTIEEFEEGVGSIVVSGYSVTHKNNTTYYDDENNSGKYTVYNNSILNINFKDNIIDKEWVITKGSQYAEVIDPINGIFNILNSSEDDNEFTISLYAGEELLYNKTFTIIESKFSGGDGSTENPYLISNVEDLKLLSRESSYWGMNYKLTNNIDLNGEEFSGIGYKSNPFTGVFDGNYCTISNFKLLTPRDGSLGLITYNEGEIKNIFLDNIIVGYGKDKQDVEISYASALVGYNLGEITNCKVSNIALDVRYSIESDFNMYAGSIAGYSGANGNVASVIEKCSVENIVNIMAYIYGSSSIFTKTHRCSSYVGGLVGYISNTKVSNCYVKKINVLFTQVEATVAKAFSGGAIGQSTKDSSINYILVYDIFDISSGIDSQYSGEYTEHSLIANWSTTTFLNNYVEKKDIGSGTDNGCYEQDVLTYESCNTISSEIWTKSAEGNPILIEQTFDKDTVLVISTDNAKTEYYYGEPFNISGIKVEGRFKNGGSTINIDSFEYDASTYNMNVIGTYIIKISALGYTTTYNVNVRKINIIGLDVNSKKTDYFVGEKINIDDFDIKYILENGDLLDLNEKLGYVKYPNEDNELIYDNSYMFVNGENKITFKCVSVDGNTIEGSTVITAMEKEVVSIEIIKNPTKMSYKFGEKFDTQGMEVLAVYSDNTSEIISNSDLEIIGDTISEGKNLVLLSYGNYINCELEVEGGKAPNSNDNEQDNNEYDENNQINNNENNTHQNSSWEWWQVVLVIFSSVFAVCIISFVSIITIKKIKEKNYDE